jgi:hypothetical protein
MTKEKWTAGYLTETEDAVEHMNREPDFFIPLDPDDRTFTLF